MSLSFYPEFQKFTLTDCVCNTRRYVTLRYVTFLSSLCNTMLSLRLFGVSSFQGLISWRCYVRILIFVDFFFFFFLSSGSVVFVLLVWCYISSDCLTFEHVFCLAFEHVFCLTFEHVFIVWRWIYPKFHPTLWESDLSDVRLAVASERYLAFLSVRLIVSNFISLLLFHLSQLALSILLVYYLSPWAFIVMLVFCSVLLGFDTSA